MKTIDEIIKGCEHDGSYIPVSEVKRLMEEYASQFHPSPEIPEVTNQEIEQFAVGLIRGELSEYADGMYEGIKQTADWYRTKLREGGKKDE